VLFATADSAITGGRDLEALRSPALSLPRKYLAQAVLGTVQDRDPAAFASGFESIVFVGVVVTLLVAVGAVALIGSRQTRPWAIALGVVALLALTWATGPRSLLFRIRVRRRAGLRSRPSLGALARHPGARRRPVRRRGRRRPVAGPNARIWRARAWRPR
jgi:hypothetical protein